MKLYQNQRSFYCPPVKPKIMLPRRTRRARRNSKCKAFDALFQLCKVKVHRQPNLYFRRYQIGQHLGFVRTQYFLGDLQLGDELLLDQNVNSVFTVKRSSTSIFVLFVPFVVYFFPACQRDVRLCRRRPREEAAASQFSPVKPAIMLPRRTRRARRNSKRKAFDAIFQLCNVEVYRQPDLYFRRYQIGQRLGFVNTQYFLGDLQLGDELLLDQNVNSVFTVKRSSTSIFVLFVPFVVFFFPGPVVFVLSEERSSGSERCRLGARQKGIGLDLSIRQSVLAARAARRWALTQNNQRRAFTLRQQCERRAKAKGNSPKPTAEKIPDFYRRRRSVLLDIKGHEDVIPRFLNSRTGPSKSENIRMIATE